MNRHKYAFLILIVCIVLLLNGCAYDSLFPTHLYFLSLCSLEAGERIYKTVDDVDSILQMKIPAKFDKKPDSPLYDHGKLIGSARDASWGKGFWIKDYPRNFEIPPAARYLADRPSKDAGDAPFTMYKFFEGINPSSESSLRYVRIRSEPVLVNPCHSSHCYAETEHRMEQMHVDAFESRYGYTWRELHPFMFSDRIIGIDSKVLDLTNNEPLAVARDYYMLPKYVSDKGSSAGGICKKPNGLYAPIEPARFIIEVLHPSTIGPRKRLYQ